MVSLAWRISRQLQLSTTIWERGLNREHDQFHYAALGENQQTGPHGQKFCCCPIGHTSRERTEALRTRTLKWGSQTLAWGEISPFHNWTTPHNGTLITFPEIASSRGPVLFHIMSSIQEGYGLLGRARADPKNHPGPAGYCVRTVNKMASMPFSFQ